MSRNSHAKSPSGPFSPAGFLCFLALLVFALPPLASASLSAELLAENDPAAARVEALRALWSAPADAPPSPSDRFDAAAAALRLNRTAEALPALRDLWQDASVPLETRCQAALLLGRAAPVPPAEAVDALSFAFLSTRNPDAFWLAAASLDRLFDSQPDLAAAHPDILPALALSRASRPRAAERRADLPSTPPPPASPSLATFPFRAFIRFYRTQISPAIGSRCALVPSCSEYFLRAALRYGPFAFPVVADRFIREPGVTSRAETVVKRPDGSLRIADPLADHFGWLTPEPLP